jgi:hypothetical protein
VANVTVFVGARPYLLTEQEGRRLGHLLRATFTDEKTDEATAALDLARALGLVVDEGLDEPLEIGWPQGEAVIRAVPEVTAHAYDGSASCCKRQNGSPTPTNEPKMAL